MFILFFLPTLGKICLIDTFYWNENGKGFEFLNPVRNYKVWTTNWFGTILITVLLNILCIEFAVFYWLWKLCTVGRKG